MQYHSVFISHSHADNAICDRYAEALKVRGFDVWYDRTNLPDGGVLSAEISRELKNRTCFIILLSEKSANSSWVTLETDSYRALAAKEPDRIILPIKISPTEIPVLLGGITWIDGTTISFEETIERITRRLLIQSEQAKDIANYSNPRVSIVNDSENEKQSLVNEFKYVRNQLNFISFILFFMLFIAIVFTVSQPQSTWKIIEADFSNPIIVARLLGILVLVFLIFFYYNNVVYGISDRVIKLLEGYLIRRRDSLRSEYNFVVRVAVELRHNAIRQLLNSGSPEKSELMKINNPLLRLKRAIVKGYREEQFSESDSIIKCLVEAILQSTQPVWVSKKDTIQTEIEYSLSKKSDHNEITYVLDYVSINIIGKKGLGDEAYKPIRDAIQEMLINPYLVKNIGSQ